jgi:hypothetical protein
MLAESVTTEFKLSETRYTQNDDGTVAAFG